MKHILLLSIVLACLSSPLEAAKKSAINVALLDFSSNNVPAEQTGNVKNRIWFRLITADVVTMLEPRATREAAIAQNEGPVSYTETKTAAKIGHYLRADYVVFGTLDRIASGGLIIYVRVVNSETGAIVHGDSEEFSGPALALYASDMLSGRLLQKLGSLEPAGSVQASGNDKRSFGFGLHLVGGYFQPLAEFSEVAGPGWNVLAAPGLVYKGLFVGFRSGYISCSDHEEFVNATMVPLAVMFLYSVTLPRYFSIDLTLSGGFSYNTLEGSGSSRDGFGPLVMGGVYAGYALHDCVRLVLGTECGAVFERTIQVFITAQGGFMFSFR